MIARVGALWSPERYHGWGRWRNYFEGWYFKLVAKDRRSAMAIIPGISMDRAGGQHAFVQCIDGIAASSRYYRFSAEGFHAARRSFAVNIDENYFSTTRVALNIDGLSGAVNLYDHHRWPRSVLSPGAMGWYSFVPGMQCYHGILSLDCALDGSLVYNGHEVDFSGGRGYIEKDWGRSFPSSWIWMQCNHFDIDGLSLTCSLARVPWIGRSFVGLIAGITHNGAVYRMTTYTGAVIERIAYDKDRLDIVIRCKRYSLTIHAEPGGAAPLLSPAAGAMTGKVNESIQAHIEVDMRENGQRIAHGQGVCGGLEIGGNVDELVAKSGRHG